MVRIGTAFATFLACFTALPAMADSIAIGKAVPFAWNFAVADVGLEAGIWKKYGFDDVKIVGFQGEAKVQQALFTKEIDVELGSGPGMAFNAKGGAGIGVAALFGSPKTIAIAMAPDANYTGPSVFKGKKIGITTVGSISDWLGQHLSQSEGWGKDGIIRVPLGSMDANLAALRTGQVDGIMVTPESAYELQDKGILKLTYNFGTLLPNFITNVVYVRKDMLPAQAEKVQRFLKGVFATIAYMRDNKAKTVEITARMLNASPATMTRVYDDVMPGYTKDGTFNPEAVALISQSFIDMGLLDKRPDDSAMFTTQFVPVHPD